MTYKLVDQPLGKRSVQIQCVRGEDSGNERVWSLMIALVVALHHDVDQPIVDGLLVEVSIFINMRLSPVRQDRVKIVHKLLAGGINTVLTRDNPLFQLRLQPERCKKDFHGGVALSLSLHAVHCHNFAPVMPLGDIERLFF